MTEMSPAETVFFAALDRADPAERAAYLDEACGADAELRRRVDRLLEAHPQVGSFLQEDAAAHPSPLGGVGARGGATADVPSTESPGTVIGPYKLLQQIGEGGMGTVYMAEQTAAGPAQGRPQGHQGRAWTASQVIARFEAERQALAMMDHVNIARVLDAGATAAGRPYFVMELVHGIAHHQVLRRQPPDAARSGWSCSCRSARRSSTPTRRASSTATSSRPTSWSRSTTASRCPRSSTSASPRRPGRS